MPNGKTIYIVRCSDKAAITCKLRAALNISEGGAMQSHCAAPSACAALTSTASHWLPSASSAAATVPAATRKLRRALNVSACAKRVSFEQKGGAGAMKAVLLAVQCVRLPARATQPSAVERSQALQRRRRAPARCG